MFEIFIKCRKTGSVYQNDLSFETREHAVSWMMADSYMPGGRGLPRLFRGSLLCV